MTESKINAVRAWEQSSIPAVFYNPKMLALCVKLPYAEGNRQFLKSDRIRDPKWHREQKMWTVPKAWFNDLINRSLGRYGRVYVIQPYREREVCAPACWKATGYECTCSCLGSNHGRDWVDHTFFVVSNTYAVRWGGYRLSCRMLTAKNFVQGENGGLIS